MSSIAFRSHAVITGFMLMFMLVLGVPAATAHADDLGLTAGSLADGQPAAAGAPDGSDSGYASESLPLYRLYNLRTGEHLYALAKGERNALVPIGWAYEGIGWFVPAEGDPVYRLYNPNTSGHFFTPSESERDGLVSSGWKSEGVSWYGHALPEDFQDDMAPWTPSISGDAVLDAELEIILFSHKTLRSAFDYVVGFGYRGGERLWSDPHYLSDATTIAFAKEILANHGGNCYRYASLFCWIARGLGYDAYVVSGWVPSASGGSAPHGWIEIWENGTAYVCDPDLAHEIGGGYNWYWFTYDNAPTTYGSW